MSGAAIRCEGLGKRFDDTWVLRDVDLDVYRGEVLGLIGPGGHGKSVLLKCLAGLLSPDAGRVLVDGEDLARLGPLGLARVREQYGYVFQNYALFDFMSVRDNVAFPLRQQAHLPPAEIDARVAARLADVGLAHALDLLPRELSGGMKKRVGLARATVGDPAILLYDDPSAGLDPVTSSKIFQLIARMHRPAAATVVVSHDIDRMRSVCSRYVMLEHGHVVFDGPEAALADAPESVRAFFFGAAHKHLEGR
ncbi:MAG: ATP-binding cassette domain-containing protein [Deltaproteobacteria bacterium]|nr:MAG: ATP-binding cassette domain-containing protein [Deltaproteobacteria bacterium]